MPTMQQMKYGLTAKATINRAIAVRIKSGMKIKKLVLRPEMHYTLTNSTSKHAPGTVFVYTYEEQEIPCEIGENFQVITGE